MPTADENIKTFAGSEWARLDAEITRIHVEARALNAQIDGKRAQIRELAAVRKYWFEVWSGKRDIEGNLTGLPTQSRS